RSIGVLYEMAGNFMVCRDVTRSVHPARRLDDAGYTGQAMGSLAKGGFQQPSCWLHSVGQDAKAPFDDGEASFVFTLADGQTKVEVDPRLASGSASRDMAEAGATCVSLNDGITRLNADLGRITKKLQEPWAAEANASPECHNEFSRNELLHQQSSDTKAEIDARKKQVPSLKESELCDVGKLATFLCEEKENGGWSLRQRRLFNAAVDELWMLVTGVARVAAECPSDLTKGSPEERVEKTALLQQYAKLFRVEGGNRSQDVVRIFLECVKLKKMANDLRTDRQLRQVIAERLCQDSALTAGMEADDMEKVFKFFINTPLAF
ncbi:hypothetical protein PQR05_38250, partial [Paraburkholderia sediminicola]|uniref:hypothetical protein n=1 Tax=Paraburkholderia sediminicola TaxID=458836 RepID=UPI0038B6DF5A